MCFNGKDITDKKEIAESFNGHFVTVGEKLAKQIPCGGGSLLGSRFENNY